MIMIPGNWPAAVSRRTTSGGSVNRRRYLWSVDPGVEADGLYQVAEIRGAAALLVRLDGTLVFCSGVEESWSEGTMIRVSYQRKEQPSGCRFQGVASWRIVEHDNGNGRFQYQVSRKSGATYAERNTFLRGASLLWTVADPGADDDPWELIIETYYSGHTPADQEQKGKTPRQDTGSNQIYCLDSKHYGRKKGGAPSDPWDSIRESFGLDSIHTGGNKSDEEENPWDSFVGIFPEGSYHEATTIGKSKSETPWSRIDDYFGGEVIRRGSDGYFAWGYPVSAVQLICLGVRDEWSGTQVLRLVELRGNTGRLVDEHGRELYAVGAGSSGWVPGQEWTVTMHTGIPYAGDRLLGAATWEAHVTSVHAPDRLDHD